MILFDEGSEDDSLKICRAAEARDPQRVRVVAHEQPKGLRACANQAIQLARGEYIIRLDADDYFDENALLVMVAFLDSNPEVGLVYPNWTYIGENGEFLGVEDRKKVGAEAKVLDLPAHGACTMVRKRVLKAIGGYDERFNSQDGHELWMKVLHRYRVGNVRTPLFFYRQHDTSMSRDEMRLLDSRRRIKEAIAARNDAEIKPRVVAVVPAKNSYHALKNVVLEPFSGKPLIDHTIDTAIESGVFDLILVTTDDHSVIAHCKGRGGVVARLRDARLSDTRAKLAEVVSDAVVRMEEELGMFPDIVVTLSVHAPLRRAGHIKEAVDTLLVYDVDQVISTYEDVELHFRHGPHGMDPLNPGMLNTLRFEREALYVDNGAVHAVWRDHLVASSLYKGRIGHIVMPRMESFQIKSVADADLIKGILERRDADA
ncbi:MAG: glycosyltransferase family 2 protein [Verrucomicrobiales bacterium]|nr:glycosyltransferase family 2 protein [Verrucomicrobiales bacterium]